VHHVGAAALGGYVYALGGLRGFAFQPIDRVYRYEPGQDRWPQVSSLPPRR